MLRCPKCHSTNVTEGLTICHAEQMEEEIRYTCGDCGAGFQKYSDITDPELRRDLRNQLEIQQEERGEWVR